MRAAKSSADNGLIVSSYSIIIILAKLYLTKVSSLFYLFFNENLFCDALSLSCWETSACPIAFFFTSIEESKIEILALIISLYARIFFSILLKKSSALVLLPSNTQTYF